MGSHLVNGEFQSDKYPTCPAGKVPLSVKDKTAQDLLWAYAKRRRSVDAEFSEDLETALRAAGYEAVRGSFAGLLEELFDRDFQRSASPLYGRAAECIMELEAERRRLVVLLEDTVAVKNAARDNCTRLEGELKALRDAASAVHAELVIGYREWDRDQDHRIGKRLSNACALLKSAIDPAPANSCRCSLIQAEDPGRHFKGCPLREERAAPVCVDGLSQADLFTACANVGVDLNCGRCAGQFFTGSGMGAHDVGCSTTIDAAVVRVVELEAALVHAGMRVAPRLHHVTGEPLSVWCLECQRDGGYHWKPCSKLAQTMAERETQPADVKTVHDLCLSMASFIAEIDSSSAKVAAYIEQRLGDVLRRLTPAELDRVGHDGRKLTAANLAYFDAPAVKDGEGCSGGGRDDER